MREFTEGQLVQIVGLTEQTESNYCFSARAASATDAVAQVLTVEDGIAVVYCPEQRCTFDIPISSIAPASEKDAVEAVKLHKWIVEPKLLVTYFIESKLNETVPKPLPKCELLSQHERSLLYHYDRFGTIDRAWDYQSKPHPHPVLVGLALLALVLLFYFIR